MAWGYFKVRVTIAALVLGSLLFGWGYKEYRLAAQSGQEPQVMSCYELQLSGQPANAYVRINGFWCDLDNTVVTYREANEERYVKTFIPLYPIIGNRGNPIILRSGNLNNDAEIQAQARQGSVEGLIVSSVDKLYRVERPLLEPLLRPGEETIILDLNRKPKTAGHAVGIMAGGGVVFISPLLFILVTGTRLKQPGDDWESKTPSAPPEPLAGEGRLYF